MKDKKLPPSKVLQGRVRVYAYPFPALKLQVHSSKATGALD